MADVAVGVAGHVGGAGKAGISSAIGCSIGDGDRDVCGNVNETYRFRDKL